LAWDIFQTAGGSGSVVLAGFEGSHGDSTNSEQVAMDHNHESCGIYFIVGIGMGTFQRITWWTVSPLGESLLR
jgi:hypothetical protein